MQPLATHVVHHDSGNKYICLYQGNLAAIPPDEAVDLLVVSAFPNDYLETDGSLIGSLARETGVHLRELALDKEADLRSVFSSWLSKSLSPSSPTVGFRQVLCFESVGQDSPAETVGLVFRAMMPFLFGEPPIRTVAMPMLAAGDQGYDAKMMLRAIFNAAVHWLERGLAVETIKLVIHRQADVERLSGLFAELSKSTAISSKQASAVANGTYNYDFFVSYAHEDTSSVDALLSGVKEANSTVRVFQDKLELKAGESWQNEIDHAIESARRVIAVFSPEYLKSDVCIEEFNMARLRHRESKQKVLTPLYLRTVEDLPLYMRTLHYIDCRECDSKLVLDAARKLAFL